MSKIELCVDIPALVGEGSLWDAEQQVLYWIDILSSVLYIYDPVKDTNTRYNVGQHIGTVVQRISGGLMLAVYEGFATFDLETQRLNVVNNPEADLPHNRFNDGKCDPTGRFWAGTMAYENPSTQGSLYRLDTDLSVHKMVENIGISNGIVWSLDHHTMYYIDSLAYSVRAYDYDLETGDISNERVVISISKDQGLPDGMTIDEEGMLWVAHYGGSCVRRWNPQTGKILQTIQTPVTQITSCAFGDKDLDTLYITSAAQNIEEPHAGALFSVKPGCRGVEAYKFAG